MPIRFRNQIESLKRKATGLRHRLLSAFSKTSLASQRPDQSISLDTALGNPIPNHQTAVLSHPLAAQALENSVQFPSRLRANSHPRFNCHGLTFGSKRTAILYDIDVNQILADDGYDEIEALEVLPGD